MVNGEGSIEKYDNTLVFIPQFPTKLRYQEWWLDVFKKEFKKRFKKVITIVGDESNTKFFSKELFSPVDSSIYWELDQIEEFNEMMLDGNEIIFVSDLSFPGFFSNVFYHREFFNCFSFCHATSLNNFDYFQPVRSSKKLIEKAHFKLYKKIFVASNYHKEKLINELNIEPDKLIVTPLPFPPFKGKPNAKLFDIISVSRFSNQKINMEFEKVVEEEFGEIVRTSDLDLKTWDDYYDILGKSRVMLITSKEETFGYQVIDAYLNQCIPVAPNKFSYPELIPQQFLYYNLESLLKILRDILSFRRLYLPFMLVDGIEEKCNNFFNVLCKEIINNVG